MCDGAALNIATTVYAENKYRGIVICGINWGGDPSLDQDPEKRSFFSDASVNDYPYRNRLLRWFESWGHPLETRRGYEGQFERSISQTNWLPDQDRSMRARDTWGDCLRHKANLFCHLDALQPRVLLFCGTSLIRILNSDACISGAEKVLGRATPLQLMKKDVLVNGKMAKRFFVGFQQFERCDVVAVPHPTGSIGLSDSYIAAFKDEIGGVISRFRSALMPNPALQRDAPQAVRP